MFKIARRWLKWYVLPALRRPWCWVVGHRTFLFSLRRNSHGVDCWSHVCQRCDRMTFDPGYGE